MTVGDDDRRGADTEDPLQEYRRHIDRIDKTIVALLSERMRVGDLLGRLKRERVWPIHAPRREADVLARVRDAAGPTRSSDAVERIFRAIIAETRARQQEGP